MFHIQSLLSRCVITGNLLRCEPCPSRSRTEARSSLPCGSTPRTLPVLTHLDGYLFLFSSPVCDTRPAASLRALSKSVAYRSTLLLALRLDASYLARSDTPVVIPGGCFFSGRAPMLAAPSLVCCLLSSFAGNQDSAHHAGQKQHAHYFERQQELAFFRTHQGLANQLHRHFCRGGFIDRRPYVGEQEEAD